MWRLTLLILPFVCACGSDSVSIDNASQEVEEECFHSDSLDILFEEVYAEYDSIRSSCEVLIIAANINSKEEMDSVIAELGDIYQPLEDYISHLNGDVIPLSKGHTTNTYAGKKEYYKKRWDKINEHLSHYKFSAEIKDFDYYFSFDEKTICESRNSINELRITCVEVARELVLEFRSKFEESIN
ncbi:hypothetical protein K6119_10725 [Paracrocinitomix mangrovi]|uniref:hypothetical protein n=1 Tax=Paracrocinitomix mangrovi TaxID=2862509 RepID=UPI001C8ECCB1|nr:hypothetical protein [Paracrocinitomix mangrovi]UKN00206.1 hypothetical protein K6119_10725 [Paracrocinitomix mangrovi]